MLEAGLTVFLHLQCGDELTQDLTQVPGPSEGCEGGERGRHQADDHVGHRHVADVHVGGGPELGPPGGDNCLSSLFIFS